MINGVIQSDMAVLSIFKNDWVQFLCASDVNISITPDILSVGTPGSGHWGKNAYQKINWTASITGVLIVNQIPDSSFTGLDMLDNLLGFSNVLIRIAYTDNLGNIKSVQGSGLVSGITWSASTGAVVKDDISIVGDGELKFFDGLFPCQTTISTITVTGQTAGDGIVHITYTYTGSPVKVKYRIDGTGNYIQALVDQTLDIPSLPNGTHDVEIIPICLNGYEGTGADIAFIVTQGLTCTSVISDITGTPTSATPVYSGTPLSMKFRIDGGGWVDEPITFVIPLGSVAAGPHTIEIVPICSNNVEGTGFIKSFTTVSQPAQSVINWTLTSFTGGNTIQIFVNGVLQVSTSTPGSGSITVPTGSMVKAVLQGNNNTGSNGTIRTIDNTTSSIMDSRNGVLPTTLQYSFTTNGDAYGILATVTP